MDHHFNLRADRFTKDVCLRKIRIHRHLTPFSSPERTFAALIDRYLVG